MKLPQERALHGIGRCFVGLCRPALRMLLPGLVVFGVSASGRSVIWAQPASFSATPGATLLVTLAEAAEFGAITGFVAGSRVDAASGRLAGVPIVPGALPVLPTVTAPARFSFALPQPGVATISADLKAETRQIAAENVERYFREIHAPDPLRDEWAKFPTGSVWRERRTIRFKTWIRVGAPAAEDHSWSEPIDRQVDLIADDDPTALHEGDTFAVRVLRDGEGVPGIAVSFVSRGELREHVVLTDEFGRAKAPLNARSPWLVRAVDIRLVRDPAYDWAAAVVAATVNVNDVGAPDSPRTPAQPVPAKAALERSPEGSIGASR